MSEKVAASLYVIHGWKVEGQKMEECLTQLSPEIIEIGLRLVFPANEKHAYFGEILFKASVEDKATGIGIAVPDPAVRERLHHAIKKVGLDMESEAPLLWFVIG